MSQRGGYANTFRKFIFFFFVFLHAAVYEVRWTDMFQWRWTYVRINSPYFSLCWVARTKIPDISKFLKCGIALSPTNPHSSSDYVVSFVDECKHVALSTSFEETADCHNNTQWGFEPRRMGWRSRCIYSLLAGRFGDRIPCGGARFSAPVQTGPGVHPTSSTMSIGSFLGVHRPGRGVDHPPASDVEVKKRVELYLSSLFAPSRSFRGWTWASPFTLPGYKAKLY